MKLVTRCLFLLSLVLGGLLPGVAQAFPDRTVRILCPTTAGSALDNFGRLLADALSRRWGRPVIVENRSGAAGQIAASALIQEAADGHTLLLVTDNMMLANRFSYRKLTYDPDTSFSPISLMMQGEQLIIAGTGASITSFDALLKRAKAEPNALSYGYWGAGSSPHLVFSMLARLAGAEVNPVPYKGVGPVVQAIGSGEIQLTVMSAGTGKTLISTGKGVPLAVVSEQRSSLYPEVPTTAELGYPDLRAGIWYGLVGPAGMPAQVVARIEEDVRAVISDPAFLQRGAFDGWKVVASSPQGMSEAIKAQLPVVAELIRTARVEAE